MASQVAEAYFRLGSGLERLGQNLGQFQRDKSKAALRNMEMAMTALKIPALMQERDEALQKQAETQRMKQTPWSIDAFVGQASGDKSLAERLKTNFTNALERNWPGKHFGKRNDADTDFLSEYDVMQGGNKRWFHVGIMNAIENTYKGKQKNAAATGHTKPEDVHKLNKERRDVYLRYLLLMDDDEAEKTFKGIISGITKDIDRYEKVQSVSDFRFGYGQWVSKSENEGKSILEFRKEWSPTGKTNESDFKFAYNQWKKEPGNENKTMLEFRREWQPGEKTLERIGSEVETREKAKLKVRASEEYAADLKAKNDNELKQLEDGIKLRKKYAQTLEEKEEEQRRLDFVRDERAIRAEKRKTDEFINRTKFMTNEQRIREQNRINLELENEPEKSKRRVQLERQLQAVRDVFAKAREGRAETIQVAKEDRVVQAKSEFHRFKKSFELTPKEKENAQNRMATHAAKARAENRAPQLVSVKGYDSAGNPAMIIVPKKQGKVELDPITSFTVKNKKYKIFTGTTEAGDSTAIAVEVNKAGKIDIGDIKAFSRPVEIKIEEKARIAAEVDTARLLNVPGKLYDKAKKNIETLPISERQKLRSDPAARDKRILEEMASIAGIFSRYPDAYMAKDPTTDEFIYVIKRKGRILKVLDKSRVW